MKDVFTCCSKCDRPIEAYEGEPDGRCPLHGYEWRKQGDINDGAMKEAMHLVSGDLIIGGSTLEDRISRYIMRERRTPYLQYATDEELLREIQKRINSKKADIS
ncbi:MAG: hypothetical protein AB1306_12020 [Nitrospirota bacterium]